MRHKIAQVIWIKAHMTDEDAVLRGYTIEQVRGNDKADELAKKNRAMHPTQRHIQSEYDYRLRMVQLVQGHMLSILSLIKPTD